MAAEIFSVSAACAKIFAWKTKWPSFEWNLICTVTGKTFKRMMPALSVQQLLHYKQTYGHEIFVETGTYLGDTVRNALTAGFSKVVSVELDDALYHRADSEFARDPRVQLWYGDSAKLLGKMLAKVDQPALVFLDAHYCGVGSNTGLGQIWIPVKFELEHLARHPIKEHTIIVDDMKAMDNVHLDAATQRWAGGPTVAGVVERLKQINPSYQIQLDQAQDRIIATIAK